MRRFGLVVGTLCIGLALGIGPACDDDDDNGGTGGTGGTAGTGGTGGATGGTGGATGGTGGATGGTGGATGGTGGATGGTGGDAGADVATGPSYSTVQPIFMAKCSPCHTTGAYTKFPINYAAANGAVTTGAVECGAGTKVGACTLMRIRSGSMPMGRNCKAEAGAPDPSMCVTAAEEATIQAWITGGLQP